MELPVNHLVNHVSLGQSKYFTERLERLERSLVSIEKQCLLSQLETVVDGKQLKYELSRLLEELDLEKQLKVLEQLKELDLCVLPKVLRLMEGLQSPDLLKLLEVLGDYGVFDYLWKLNPDRLCVLTVLEGLKPLERRKLLTVLEELLPLELQKLLIVLEELSPLELRKLLIVLKGLLSLEPRVLLTLLKGLSLPESPKLLTVLKGLNQLEQEEKVLTLVEGLKVWEQWKLLELLGDLGKVKQRKLLGLLELIEPVELLKLLERVGPQERQNFYQLLVLLEPLKLKMLLELELKRLESLGSKVEKLERMKLQALLEAYKRLLQLLLEWLNVYLSEDGDRRGGFRNLLLDGWWLEFWEIILLAAGDVERNPGPRRMTDKELEIVDSTILITGDLSEVFDAVHNCRAKWRNLCLILGISNDDLSAIKKEQSNDSDDCLCEGLTRWLRGDYDTKKHGRPTWRSLVDAVANSSGGDDHALAVDIAEEHKNGANEAQSVVKSTEDFCCQEREHSRRGFQQNAEFTKMFGSMVRSIGRSLKVGDLRRFLRYFSNPYLPHQRYIEPSIYEGAERTGDILDCLYPKYINPENTYLLEEIVRISSSRQCKRLLEKYTKKYE